MIMPKASGCFCFVIGRAASLGAHLCEKLLDLDDEVICFENFYIDTSVVELHHSTGLMPAKKRLAADFARGGILQQANSRLTFGPPLSSPIFTAIPARPTPNTKGNSWVYF